MKLSTPRNLESCSKPDLQCGHDKCNSGKRLRARWESLQWWTGPKVLSTYPHGHPFDFHVAFATITRQAFSLPSSIIIAPTIVTHYYCHHGGSIFFSIRPAGWRCQPHAKRSSDVQHFVRIRPEQHEQFRHHCYHLK